jgi:hypothetical protein
MRPENGEIGRHGINTGEQPVGSRSAVLKAGGIECGGRNERGKKAMS